MEDEPIRPDSPDTPDENQDNSNEQNQQKQKSSHPSPRTLQKLMKPGGIPKGPVPPVGMPGVASGLGAGGSAAGGAGAGAAGSAASGASAAATGASTAASGAGGIIGFFSTPPGWVVLALIILFLLILFLYLALQNQQNGEVTVTLTKTAPAEVKNDENIPYKLNVSYTGNPSQIIVTDPLPENTEFVSAGQNAQTLDASGKPTTDPTKVKTVKWTLSGSGGNSASGSGTATGDNSPPNKDTCGGIYDSISQGGQHNGDNFGDPSCTLAKSQRTSYEFKGHHWDGVPQGLIDLLKQLDPDNVGYWIGISSCEAPGFDPNNVSVAVNGSAYGLFQMGSSYSGGKETPYGTSDGLNGKYDRGDVNWQNQISNAVNYNKQVGGNWTYWACARDVWGLW
jgi:uncharacterized repeat protein (TIGR01451 family)